jgi:hypothetical protein
MARRAHSRRQLLANAAIAEVVRAHAQARNPALNLSVKNVRVAVLRATD